MWLLILAAVMAVQTGSAFAMEAPGNGGSDWYYSDKDHHWYYYDEDKNPHKGWLQYEGEWYWFDQYGWMADGGSLAVDGVPYYFFVNGHMAWNQYIGLKYYNGDGQQDEENNIRVVGSENPTSEDKDLITDYLYEVPRTWIAQFIKDGWQFMFYKKKNYFAAPSTNMGIYYVYHSIDTHYKKAKFTETDSVLEAFGEYVGYAAGCYKEDDSRMQELWNDYNALQNILEIPDYYANDAQFYFGKLFACYLDGETKDDMVRNAPEACEILEEILHLKDDEETRMRLKEKREADRKAAAEWAAQAAAEEGYGPGVKRPEEEKTE